MILVFERGNNRALAKLRTTDELEQWCERHRFVIEAEMIAAEERIAHVRRQRHRVTDFGTL